MKTLYVLLGQMDDFRRAQGQRFTLQAFLEMVILAGMSGHFGINAISRFILNNEAFFIQRYGLHHGVPKKTVIFNILYVIDYSQLNNVLRKWMSQFIDSQTHTWMSIDGKALCSTVTDQHGQQQNFQSIVSLFSQQMALVVGTEQMEKKKSHEGDIAREIIRQLELKGVTFTLDALHCQKTVETIVDGGNDYVIQVKANQPNLLKAIKTHTAQHDADHSFLSTQINRGRKENREVHIYNNAKAKVFEDWKGLYTIIRVKHWGVRDKEAYEQYHWYISSRKDSDAQIYACGIRGHWHIENKLHWVKDAILKEDNSMIKGNILARNLSMIRTIVMNTYRLNKETSIKKAIENLATEYQNVSNSYILKNLLYKYFSSE